MRNGLLRATCCAIALCAMLSSAIAQSDDHTAQFFNGKTIKLAIGSGSGGGVGAYGLVFAQYFRKYIPGNPSIITEFRPGAGGVVAANYLYNAAPKDGTVIGLPLATLVLAQLTGTSIQYDASKFNWIGQIAGRTQLLTTVWHSSPLKTFGDLTTHETVAGTTGKGSETYMNPALMNHVFGTKIKIVSGYKGQNDLWLALERGEISNVSGRWADLASNHPGWLRENKVRFLVQIGNSKAPGQENVPLLSDLARTDSDRQLVELMALATESIGYSIMAPPGVPAPRVAALRTAFDATMKDPDFVASVKKCCVEVSPASYRTLEESVRKTVNSPKALVDRFIQAIGY
jgi:tripartite-type tricarboxylate transporter receptor subunit TctC